METPIFCSHLRCMRASKDLRSNRIYQAMRSNEVWIFDEIYTLLRQPHVSQLLKRLGVLNNPAVMRASSEEKEIVEDFWALTAHMASERSWYMLHFSHTAPEMFAGILDEDNDERAEECMGRIALVAEAIMRAEEVLGDPNHPERFVFGLVGASCEIRSNKPPQEL